MKYTAEMNGDVSPEYNVALAVREIVKAELAGDEVASDAAVYKLSEMLRQGR